MRALYVLIPPESKKLIGKAVGALKEVKKAKKQSKILVGHGSTNLYVAEAILGKKKFTEVFDRDAYLSGVIQRGTLCTIPSEKKLHSGSEPGSDRTAAPYHIRIIERFRPRLHFYKGGECRRS
jgi:hypothetical protein